MRREVERMMRLRLISIIFCVLLCIVLVAIVGVVLFMNTGDYSGINPQFGKIEASEKAKTVSYSFGEFDKLAFFSELYDGQRTLFRQSVPKLNIVNSRDYRVEITANGELIDKLHLELVKDTLYIAFKGEYYEDVERNNKIYKGLFVDCDTFEVTVYAPVSSFHTSAKIDINYEAPKTDYLWVVINGEILDGKIFHVDSKNAVFSFNGSSNVEISGKVSQATELVARHNTSIDATELEMTNLYTRTTAQIFGLSMIKYPGGRDFPVFDAGVIISILAIFFTALFAGCFILFRVKFFRQKEKIDKYVEEQKKLEKYLKI